MLQKKFEDFMDQNFYKAAHARVALAISGGSDSMALLFLASNWAKIYNIDLVIFSVDHKLRKESSEEISFVEKHSLKLGHQFISMIWEHNNSKSAIQEKARIARYNMMTQKCHELKIKTLLTAHHYDDFLENYLMRKKKKSGILGLSNSYGTFYNNIQILRPLFDIKKNTLTEYLISNAFKWKEDESNKSDYYERNRVRQYIASLSNEKLYSLQQEANKATSLAHNFNDKFISEIAEIINFNKLGFAHLNLDSYLNLDREIQIYLINFVLTTISGKKTTPRYRNTQKILSNIELNQNFTCSLHECIIKKNKDKLTIFREKNFIQNQEIDLKHKIIWDNRFEFNLSNTQNYKNYKVSKLNSTDYITLKNKLDINKLNNFDCKEVLFTLPIIKKLEKIVAIPHICYYDDFKSNIDIIFKPRFVSRFTHFL